MKILRRTKNLSRKVRNLQEPPKDKGTKLNKLPEMMNNLAGEIKPIENRKKDTRRQWNTS